ncbi:hypothetical protein C8F04DRAFT_1204826 [Mycena alexandri]|uniref:Uncharacterized protein n=1 Tax=Mycena alexandri TaxID=1745969 RepID=A0AAD6RVY4_9AGAR|nr:hypothetical protein C8F04DRAFT_1204826 [Mycena alexandri]
MSLSTRKIQIPYFVADLSFRALYGDAANYSSEDDWVDEDEDEPTASSTLPPTPPSPLTPLSSPSSSAIPSPQSSRATSLKPPTISIEKTRHKIQAANRRKQRWQRQHAGETPYDKHPDARYSQAHRQQESHTVHFDLADAPAAAGAWGCEVVEGNGWLIVDDQGRIIAILLGTPEDDEWPGVIKDAVAAMARTRKEAIQYGEWRVGTVHRHGTHLPMRDGVTFGGGQKHIAGFQSSRSLFGTQQHASEILAFSVRSSRTTPKLTHTFRNSIFPAITLNCGDAVSFEHCDMLNCVHGLCPVTSGGDFDHVLSGHLYLRQLRLIIQFPSGATILIPSAASTTATHRSSPTKLATPSHSMLRVSAKTLLAQPGGQEVKDAFDSVPGSRWKWGLNLFSKYDKLETDRVAAFQST